MLPHNALECRARRRRSRLGAWTRGLGTPVPNLLAARLRVRAQAWSLTGSGEGSDPGFLRELFGKKLRGQGGAGTWSVSFFPHDFGGEFPVECARPKPGAEARRWHTARVVG